MLKKEDGFYFEEYNIELIKIYSGKWKVSISVSDTNDSWKVIIKDTGIGIPASEQSKLFKLHFRASNAINSKVTGSGIGLMLVGNTGSPSWR